MRNALFHWVHSPQSELLEYVSASVTLEHIASDDTTRPTSRRPPSDPTENYGEDRLHPNCGHARTALSSSAFAKQPSDKTDVLSG